MGYRDFNRKICLILAHFSSPAQTLTRLFLTDDTRLFEKKMNAFFWLRKPEQKYLVWVDGGNKREEKAAWERQTGKLLTHCHLDTSVTHVQVLILASGEPCGSLGLANETFPCNELGGLSSGAWESTVPGLRNQLLVKTLHTPFWEKKQGDTSNESSNSKHKK